MNVIFRDGRISREVKVTTTRDAAEELAALPLEEDEELNN
jgi:hypothetical protein